MTPSSRHGTMAGSESTGIRPMSRVRGLPAILTPILATLLLVACARAPADDTARAAAPDSPALADDAVLERIAFGSCLHQSRDASILDRVLADDPDLALMIGDNVYGDVDGTDLAPLRAAYAEQAASAPLNRLRAAVPMLAVWDDHDYGVNDGGGDFALRREAEALFDTFWHVDPESPAGRREGVHDARIVGPPGRRVQVILLDTRSFRSPLRPTDERGAPGRERWLPDPDPSKTMLGADQWAWLGTQLRRPAELRLLVSSIQVLADGHGWEAWRTLPTERSRLFGLLAETGAEGVVLLSGDRHRAGIYRHDEATAYPLWEITSSSLNLPIPGMEEEAGPRRVGATFVGTNYGMVEVDWDAGRVALSVRDDTGTPVRRAILDLAALR
jgi:alkaline phosphatase D